MPKPSGIATRLLAAAVAAGGLVTCVGLAPITTACAAAQSSDLARPAFDDYDGAIATGLALRRLGNTARVLHIGAHPDDENTALFAPLVLGRGADAAYLSLTRGEGGQNGIGRELGVALGLIRSGELLAARRLDGAGQFFARAIDYGYSRSAAEAFTHWPPDSLLADVVAVIRRYRPDIVISVWSGTPRDGHGQHEASGIVARRAVLAAADPDRFPEQIEAGLRPHRTARFFWSARYSADGPTTELATGVLDPLLGRSYHQVAMASRSRHRSQDMGVPQAPGPRFTAFERVDPVAPPALATLSGFGFGGASPPRPPAGAPGLFDGVDTLLSQRARRLAGRAVMIEDRLGLSGIAALLADYEERVARLRAGFDAGAPWRMVSDLAAAHGSLTAISGGLGESAVRDPALLEGVRDLYFHLRAEIDDLHRALPRAANVELDVVASRELVVPGETFDLELSIWNGGPLTIRAQAGPLLPPGWREAPAPAGDQAPAPTDDQAPPGDRAPDDLVVGPGERVAARFRVTVPGDAPPTMPYYIDLDAPAGPHEMYAWPHDHELRGLAFAPDPVAGSFLLEIGDALVPAERPARWVGVDRRSGEFRRPVRVVPAVSVALDPAAAILPLDRADRGIEVTARLRAEAPDGISGELRLEVPDGWRVEPGRVELSFDGRGEERSASFRVTPPRGVAAGEHRLRGVFEAAGRAFDAGYRIIDYPHIEPRHLFARAEVRLRTADVRVADVRVGYVVGAGDGVPEALDQLGTAWEPLDAQTLPRADLDRYDVIVTGIRAYEVRPDLATHNPRLLDWARRGGTLIIQYSQYAYATGGFAPWPVTIARPHGRVTDPAAPVTMLEPGHPVFNSPNAIGPADWHGWVQERGLYFLESWDGPFDPLLALSDPGEETQTGALLVAPLGRGTYVYTGLALFRQLPEGVPGAFRLLANLISLGAR